MKSRSSTVVCWVLEDRTGIVTADSGEGEALIVFRNLKEARGFQERTAPEGFELVGKSYEALLELLSKYDLGWVAVHDARSGEHMVDLFATPVFVERLDEELGR